VFNTAGSYHLTHIVTMVKVINYIYDLLLKIMSPKNFVTLLHVIKFTDFLKVT